MLVRRSFLLSSAPSAIGTPAESKTAIATVAFTAPHPGSSVLKTPLIAQGFPTPHQWFEKIISEWYESHFYQYCFHSSFFQGFFLLFRWRQFVKKPWRKTVFLFFHSSWFQLEFMSLFQSVLTCWSRWIGLVIDSMSLFVKIQELCLSNSSTTLSVRIQHFQRM